MKTPGHLYFFISFGHVGLAIIVPQAFFFTHTPDHVYPLLPICLALGALASLGGMYGANALWPRFLAGDDRARSAQLAAHVVLYGLGLILMWNTAAPYLFIAYYVLMKCVAQSLFTLLDRVCVARSDDPANHAQRVVVFDILGTLAGPLFFAAIYGRPGAYAAVIAALALYSGAHALRLVRALRTGLGLEPAPVPATDTPDAPYALNALDAPDSPAGKFPEPRPRLLPIKSFMTYCFCVVSTAWIFSTQLVPLIGDYYGLAGPIEGASILIGVLEVVAVVSVLGAAKLAASHDGSQSAAMRPLTHFLLCVVFIGLTIALHSRWSTSYPYLGALAVLTGATYGLFMSFTREVASRLYLATGNTSRVLDWYNNLPNFAVLAAAVMLLGTGTLTERAGLGIHPVILGMFVFLAMGIAATGFLSRARDAGYDEFKSSLKGVQR